LECGGPSRRFVIAPRLPRDGVAPCRDWDTVRMAWRIPRRGACAWWVVRWFLRCGMCPAALAPGTCRTLGAGHDPGDPLDSPRTQIGPW